MDLEVAVFEICVVPVERLRVLGRRHFGERGGVEAFITVEVEAFLVVSVDGWEVNMRTSLS